MHASPIPARTASGAFVLSAALLVIPPSPAQDRSPYVLINASAASSEIVITPARSGVSMLSGSGGNITVLSGSEGTLLVDGGIAVSRDKIVSALGELGADFPKYVVSTHWHWDHTDGNGWLREGGATIMAHPKTIAHLSDTIEVVEWEHVFTPVAASALPGVSVDADRDIQFGGEQVQIRTYPDGHTDGDLWVRFERADVISMGDSYWNGQYPFIDYATGGGIDGLIEQTARNLSEVSETTLIVPGHGPLGRRADLVAYRDMLVDIRARVAALKASGMTVDQVISARPTAPYDDKWGRSVVTPEMFTALVFRGV